MLQLLGAALLLSTQAAAAAPPTAATCVDPAAREAFLKQTPENGGPAAAMKVRAEQRTAEFRARLDRLVTRGKLSAAQRTALLDGWRKDATVASLQTTNGEIMKTMEADMQVLTSGTASERQSCMVVVGMFEKLSEVDANSVKQAAILNRALEAEAKKRGVSLNP